MQTLVDWILTMTKPTHMHRVRLRLQQLPITV
jgi:hypothetical protein